MHLVGVPLINYKREGAGGGKKKNSLGIFRRKTDVQPRSLSFQAFFQFFLL